MDRRWGIIGVLLVLAAWGCWQGMEGYPDYSPPSTALFYGGYILVALAFAAFFVAFRNRTT